METRVAAWRHGACYDGVAVTERNRILGMPSYLDASVGEDLLEKRRKLLEKEKACLGERISEEVDAVLETMRSNNEVFGLSEKELAAIREEVEADLRAQREESISDELDILARLEQNI
jgi:hypothetical protein